MILNFCFVQFECFKSLILCTKEMYDVKLGIVINENYLVCVLIFPAKQGSQMGFGFTLILICIPVTSLHIFDNLVNDFMSMVSKPMLMVQL